VSAELIILGVANALRPTSLAAVNAWARNHNRQILIAVFAAAGAYLTIKGTINLLD